MFIRARPLLFVLVWVILGSMPLEASETLHSLLLHKQQQLEKTIAELRSSEERARGRLGRAQAAERAAVNAHNPTGAENARKAASLSEQAISEARRRRAAENERLEAVKQALGIHAFFVSRLGETLRIHRPAALDDKLGKGQEMMDPMSGSKDHAHGCGHRIRPVHLRSQYCLDT